MTQGTFALGGVVLGVFLKAVLDYFLEQQRWAREDRHYFKSKRLDAYVSLIVLAEQMALSGWELYEAEDKTEYVNMMKQFLSAYQTAYLLASSTTRNVANGVLEAVNQCTPMSKQKPSTLQDVTRNHTLLYQRITLLQNQAQKELGIF